MKAFIGKIFARYVVAGIRKDNQRALDCQEKVLKDLLSKASNTNFGKDHDFVSIKNHTDFIEKVPIRDYEELKDYTERMVNGEADVLWPGKPIYLSKTSGTTSGAKYIPITKESISNHIVTARNALLSYIVDTGKSSFINGKMIFLQGSPTLEEKNGIQTGRLSGIVAHHVPSYLLKNRMPSFSVNCIDDWEEKVSAIAEETLKEDMSLISGIPPWVQMYFEILLEKTGKESISEIFPNFSLLVYGGVNYQPYKKGIEKLIGKKIDSVEVYPASEGFIAYQDKQSEEGMLLNTNSGIFYEFVKADEVFNENAKRIWLKDVEMGVNYAIILSNNAGLWAYNIGDTVKFVSLDPYRIVVTGRIKHFTSAFGEHVIAEEVEGAVKHVMEKKNVEIHEFHVAPMVDPGEGILPYHEWFIEMDLAGHSKEDVASEIDHYMQKRNPYYRDLREGNILQQLKLTVVINHGFNEYMKSIGKLGGQNKLPRLSNDRNIADALSKFLS